MATLFAALRVIGALLLAILVALALWPLAPVDLTSYPHRLPGFDDAVRRFEDARAHEPGTLDPRCGSRLLSHGRRTARIVVLVHGLTNCPHQFAALADTLFARGDNVLLVRLPEHGYADRRGRTLGRLTAGAVIAATDSALDLADALGDSVLVAGLSVGGLAAVWAAEQRPDVRRVVVIAPMVGLGGLPSAANRVLAQFWALSPDAFHWWDPRVRERLPGPTQCYWGWSTRGMAEMMRLAGSLRLGARRQPPRAGEIVLVLNANDIAIDNGAARDLLADWRARRPGHVASYEFPKSLGLGHDLIDPEQPDQRVAIVYPVLVSLLHDGVPAR